MRLLTVDIRTGRIPAVAREGVADKRVALGDYDRVRFLPALPQATLPQATLPQATLPQATLSQVTLSQVDAAPGLSPRGEDPLLPLAGGLPM